MAQLFLEMFYTRVWQGITFAGWSKLLVYCLNVPIMITEICYFV